MIQPITDPDTVYKADNGLFKVDPTLFGDEIVLVNLELHGNFVSLTVPSLTGDPGVLAVQIVNELLPLRLFKIAFGSIQVPSV